MIEEKDKIQIIKSIYEQHWLHARHVEQERYWFINIFMAIFSVSLGYIINNNTLFLKQNIPIYIFLMIISLYGTLFCIKIDSIFKTHTKAAENIVKYFKLYDFWMHYNNHWVNRRIRISRLYPIFFFTCFNFLLFIILQIFFNNYLISSIISLSIYIVSYKILIKIKYENLSI